MQPVLNVEDVKRVEQALTLEGVSLAELMRRAGHAAAQEVVNGGTPGKVCVLCGSGNNGGDGWVAAELLKRANVDVTVVCPAEPSTIKGSLALMVARSAVAAGVPYRPGPSSDELAEIVASSDVVLDAMLGTGFEGEPRAPFDLWIDVVNSLSTKVVSIDVASGLSAQTGLAPAGAVVADTTVTMLSLKPGLLSDAGRALTGNIVLAPLATQTSDLVLEADPVAWRLDLPDYVDCLQVARTDVDKYTRGSVLVVAGSVPYIGAAVLAARAAARMGAGYVTLAVPQPIATVCRTHLVEIPVVGLPASPTGTFSEAAKYEICRLTRDRSAVVVGPGLQVNADTEAIVEALLATDRPLVVDADGLNALSRLTSGRLDRFPEVIRRSAPLVLTPHRRELGRLVGQPTNPPASLSAALEAARKIVWADGGSELCVVAKGAASACVGVDIAYLPNPGPPALATAGTGDVLSGVIGALLATGGRAVESLPLLCAYGCEAHGLAGHLAVETRGSRGVMALDVAEGLGLALDTLEERILAGEEEA